MFEFRRSSTKSRWQLPPPLLSPPPIRTLDPPVRFPAPSRKLFEEGAFEWCKCSRDEKRIDCTGSIDVGLGGYLVHHGARRWMRTIYPPLFGRQHPEPKSPYDVDISQIQSRIPGSTASGCTVFRLHPDPGQVSPRDQPSLYVCWDWHWEKPPECYDADGNAVTPVSIVDSTNTEGHLPRPSTQQDHTRNPYPTHLASLNLHCSASPSKSPGGDANASTGDIDTEHENDLPREIIDSGCLTLGSTGSIPDARGKGKKAQRPKHWRLGNYLTSLSGMSSFFWRGKDKFKLPVLTGGGAHGIEIASDIVIHGEVPGSWPSEPEFNYDVINQVRESPVMSVESRISKHLEGNDHGEASGKVMQDELEIESIIHKVRNLTDGRELMPLGNCPHQLEVSETLDLSGLGGLSELSTSEMAPNSSTKQSAQPPKSFEGRHDHGERSEHSEHSKVAELPAIAIEAKAIAKALDVSVATNFPNTLIHHNRDGINSKIAHNPDQKFGALSALVKAVTDGLQPSSDRSLKSPLKSTSDPLPTFTIANLFSNSADIARGQQGLRFSYRRESDSSGPDRRRIAEFSSTKLSRLISGNKVLGHQRSNVLRKWTFESVELGCKTSTPEFDDYSSTPWKVICVDGQDAPILVYQSESSGLNSDFQLTLVCQYLDKKLYEEKPPWIKMHLLSSLPAPFISTPAASPPGIAPHTIQDYLEQTIAGPNLNPRWEVVAGFLSSHLSKQALSIPWCHVSGDFHLLNVCGSDWADYATLTYQTLQEQGSMHVPRAGLVLARDARTFMDFLEAVMGVDSDSINYVDNGWTETWVASVVDPALCTRYHRTVWQEASQLLSHPPSENWLMQEFALAKQAWERRGEQVIELTRASEDISRLQFAPAQHASVHETKKPEVAGNHDNLGFGATVGLHSKISVASFMNPTSEIQDEYSAKPDILDLDVIVQNSIPARGVSFDLSTCTTEFEAKPLKWRTFTPPPISDEQHTSIGKIALTDPSSPKIDPLDDYEKAEIEPLIGNRNLDTYSEMGSVRFVNGLATPPGTPPVTPFTNPLEIATPPSSPPPRTRNRGSLANLNSDWWKVPGFPETGYGYFNLADSYSLVNTIPCYRSCLISPSSFDNNVGCIDLSGPTEFTGSDIDGEFDPQLLMSPLALSAPPPMGAQDGGDYELELELEPSLEASNGFARNTNTNHHFTSCQHPEPGVDVSRIGVDRQEVALEVGQFNGDARTPEVTLSDKQPIAHGDDTHSEAIRDAMQPELSSVNDDWDDFYCSQLFRTNTSTGVAVSKSAGLQERRSAIMDILKKAPEMRGHAGSIKVEEGMLANPPIECHLQKCRPLHRCYAERRVHNRDNNKGLVHTHDEIIRELKDFVKKKELEVFFKDDEEEKVLHSLACQVSKNINPTSHSVDAAKHLLDLSKTALYTTIFLVDDSTSVKQNQLGGPLIKALTKATEMATTLKLHNRGHNSTDGKDNQNSAEVIVRFLNNRTTHAMDRVSSVAEMRAILKKIKWKGGTELGTMLQKKVLEPFVLEKARNGTLKQPVLVKIITDGKPEEYKARTSSKYKGKGIMKGEPPETLKQVVLNCKKELGKTKYGEHAVAFQMIQIGDNQDADGYLNQLAADPEVGKHIYCTSDTQVVKYSTPGCGLTQAYNHWWIDETLVAIDPDSEDESGSCGNNIQDVNWVPEFRNGGTCSNLR